MISVIGNWATELPFGSKIAGGEEQGEVSTTLTGQKALIYDEDIPR